MIQHPPVPRDAHGQEIDLHPIAGLLDRIAAAWHPKAVWLFGSRAKGTADPESDWDLLVVVPDDECAVDDPLAGWNLAKTARVRSDVILCRASDFHDALETPNTLAYEAGHHGVEIYGH